MKTSLIIPTYNKIFRLKFLLKSLLLLEGKESFDVVIVDDGSSDGTKLLLKQFLYEANKAKLELKIRNIKNSGRSVARNYGANEANGELLIFTDDDLILSPRFIKAHQDAHQKNNYNIVRGRIYDLPYLKFFKNPETGELFDNNIKSGSGLRTFLLRDHFIEPSLKKIRMQAKIRKYEKDIHELYINTPKDHKLRWIGCTGGNFSVLKKNFISIGGFDENLGKAWGCEDLEFGYRLKKAGADIIIENQAENFHISHFRANAKSEHEKAVAYFYAKHMDKSIIELNNYFEGKIQSLLEWKSLVE